MNKRKLVTSLLLAISVSSCGHSTSSKSDSTLVGEKYLLLEDRSRLEELRKEVPKEKKIENDEVALNLQWMNEVKLNPSDIRSKFSDRVSKNRNSFNRDLNSVREEFTKAERQKREEFNNNMGSERAAISSRKKSFNEKKVLYDELENKRKDFSAKQKLERDTFEEELREKRKSFEDYIKQKTDTFNMDLKTYTVEFNERKKVENQVKKNLVKQPAREP